jgi:tripartite-type tricarboxylate transporter receptor subunit TctC
VWYAMFAPAKTPPEIVARLSRETLKALESPEVGKQLVALTIEAWPGSAAELGALVQSETARYAKVIKGIGLRLD